MSDHTFCRLYRREALAVLPADAKERFKSKNYGIIRSSGLDTGKKHFCVELVGARTDGKNAVYSMTACCKYDAISKAAEMYMYARERGEVK
jgi:hypothetical protein